MEIIIKQDGIFDLATGRSRRETSWRNKEMSWSELVTRVSTTHRTAETHAEYMAAKKPRQDEIKDVGGFVGAYLSNGRRKSGNVAHRQLLTLDLDFAKSGFWDDFTLTYLEAALIYSTHKHSADSPRLRLIIPLDRPVMRDEYEAIARKVAGNLDIEIFDPTTFQAERLMYWPSTSKDGVFEFEYQDGKWLCADEVLNSYRDWRDVSEWPISSRVDKLLVRSMQKQGDPLEKTGVVGAFCRSYSISEAIEKFLSSVYDACDIDSRYTYKEGSTAAGLVVYEDKYAFSHHGTDPVSGKLCNAFDLVRLHRFGLKDEDVKEGTPGNKLPSYTAMIEFASKDDAVRKLIVSEKLADAKADFEGLDLEDEQEEDDSWQADLSVDKRGNIFSTINNIVLILNNDPFLKGKIALNSFEKREVVLGNLPWRKITANTRYLTDTDDAALRHYIEKRYEITGVQKIKDAMDIVCMQHAFHPVRNYLDGLQWDGIPRVDTLFIDFMGVRDSAYTRAVSRKALVAAVNRIYRPGCKFDYVLVLVGKQGQKKSSMFDKLGRDWFSDSFGTVQGKEAYEQLQGVWLVEMAELAGLRKAEVETIKHFISKREDRYRVAYGRRLENFPRQCVFFGTSNNKDFLRDPTGNRRFWPLDTYEFHPAKDVFKDLDDYEVGQVWAEAVEFFHKGEPLYLSAKLEEEAYAMQEEHSEKDERAGMIQQYLDTLLPVNWGQMDVYERRSFLQGGELEPVGKLQRDRVCVAEIWCEVLGGQQKEMNRFNTKDIHDIMRVMPGWEEAKSVKIKDPHYGVLRGYVRVKKVAAKFEKVATSEN